MCFNANLAEYIRREMLPADTQIDVMHFHGLCEFIARQAGLPPPAERDAQYFEQGCADRLVEAWATGNIRQYDAIIVDEGQDLRRSWISALEECLLADNGRFLVLYDPLQDLYGVGEYLPERLGTAYPVTTNCRNTVAICDFVRATRPRELIDLRPADHSLPGLRPKIRSYQNADEQRKQIESIVSLLVKEHGLKPRQILLLSPYRREHTCLAHVDSVDGYRLMDYSRCYEVTDDDVLFHETVMSFKGLDADAVIIHDLRRDEWGADIRKLYVAFSRARFGLWVLREKGLALPQDVG